MMYIRYVGNLGDSRIVGGAFVLELYPEWVDLQLTGGVPVGPGTSPSADRRLGEPMKG